MNPSTRSFYAIYRLLGGPPRLRETGRHQAKSSLRKRLQGLGGHIVVVDPLCESALPPEIFAHCKGTWPTAVTGKCFGCKVVLTDEHAAAAEPIDD